MKIKFSIISIAFNIFSYPSARPFTITRRYSSTSLSAAPLVISSSDFASHVPRGYHPECPERIIACLVKLEELNKKGLINVKEPNINRKSEALEIINNVHDNDYVKEVKLFCEQGRRLLSPFDEDTYISSSSYETCLLAQVAWLDCVDAVVQKKTKMAFAMTRPPGHHALRNRSMGFCIFNFAVGSATYALKTLRLKKIAILDFDVHYGNGVSHLVSQNPNICYCSLHQLDIFPPGGSPDYKGPLNNILNVPLKYGAKWKDYEEQLTNHAVPFLSEFDADLLIVCAGYDALASDDMANVLLLPEDYEKISKIIKKNFDRAVFGLEGGYNLRDLPLAVEETLKPWQEE